MKYLRRKKMTKKKLIFCWIKCLQNHKYMKFKHLNKIRKVAINMFFKETNKKLTQIYPKKKESFWWLTIST